MITLRPRNGKQIVVTPDGGLVSIREVETKDGTDVVVEIKTEASPCTKKNR